MSLTSNFLFSLIWGYGWKVALVAFLYVTSVLVGRIAYPIILRYPWPHPTTSRRICSDKRKIVVLAGSYNPPHLGHLAMIQYLGERYRKVIVVIGVNPNKRYDVTPEERADLTRRMLKRSATSSNVEVHVVKGYIWRHAKREGAEIFFRGIRSWEKDGREERALQILNTWGPLLLGPLWYPIPTQFLEGKPEYNHISSTLIRDLSSIPNSSVTDLEHLVPKSIVKDVTKLYGW